MLAVADAVSRRLMVVDDEAANVEALRATLTARGYVVEGFTEAATALDALGEQSFALLLADLNMPGISGLELLLQAQARDPHLVGVIMTGDATVASAVEAMKGGAVDYVLKPLRLSTLAPVIERALTIRRLRIDNAALERGLRSRTGELEAALQEVGRQTSERLKAEQALMQAQKMEAIGRLTGGVAHDFNNLLTAVTGNLELIGRRIDEASPLRRYVDNALEAAARGSRVTGQLLAFSRTQRLKREPVEVDAVLRQTEALLRHGLGPDVQLEMALAAPGAWASTDATQLELAVLNLIVNARDALPGGGTIRLETRLDGDRLVVEVADNGAGMAPEVLARAAEPFFTTKREGGSGLGLAQVYGFARQCEGDCEIESAPGKGTRVCITLPRERPAGASLQAGDGPPTEAPPSHKPTVLVIDDDDQVRETLCEGLRSEGCDVVSAAGGLEGLAMIGAERPDVVVLDYAMPVMTGAEVARRAKAAHPDLPIIFCSGYADSLALDQIDGAVVLRKPIAIEDLGQAVRAALK
jgi:signal transduction histidine kinase